jgi:predicted glycoside hydrolase/deacetylase ChbG (UPF0249 family)
LGGDGRKEGRLERWKLEDTGDSGMSDILIRIKRAMLAGRYVFSEKAKDEMERDDLTDQDVIEAILNADYINKTIRSTSPYRAARKEYLHIIISENLNGLAIYTKGKIVEEAGEEHFYFLVSSKQAE